MELQFHKTAIPCMQRVMYQVQDQEQTQEVRLSEDMPDIGKVLGCWGQVLIRGKEWRGDGMNLSGGVMVWVMYMPEDGVSPQWVDSWIPFQMRWDFGCDQPDGAMRILPGLRFVDARSTSARKLMVRAALNICAEALVPSDAGVYAPGELPEDVQVLRREYPMVLPKEAGEKPFVLEEELTLPSSCPKMEKLIRYSLRPELIDKKVMADKAVFRGAAIVHILYKAEDGSLHTWDFDVPYSQYTELDREYDPDSDVQFWMALTSMELEQGEEGKLLLKAGLTGQYVVLAREMIGIALDAYSPRRSVTVQKERVQLPAVLEQKTEKVQLLQTLDAETDRVADISVMPEQPRVMHMDGAAQADLGAGVQMLYYDREGMLQSAHKRWEEAWKQSCGEDCRMYMQLQLTGKPQASFGADSTQVRGELLVDSQATAQQGLDAVVGLTLGEMEAPDPGRPSLVLRAMGDGGLWDMAKRTGSTVDAIRKANALEADPEPGRLLLIPVS